jgi:benzoyl-CoA reductase/2-hydroxyglutaryl-CoA dehydratase subunit BcrC/BadD/HgdB
LNETLHTPIRDGLFDRLVQLADVITALPDQLSDEEVAGLRRVLPADTARAIGAAFEPYLRRGSVPFLKLAARHVQQARRARAEGRKVILMPFNFPPEVILIFRSAVPLCCEVITTLGVAVLEGAGERYWDEATALGLPDFLCSSSTIELGSILSSRDFRPDGLVQSTAGACDANSKVHEFVSLHLGIPQFFIEKPADSSARSRAHQRRYFRRFIAELERFTGETLDEGYMRQVLELANEATDLWYEFYDLHKFTPCPVPNLFSLFSYGTRFTSWGQRRAVDALRAMTDLGRERLERGLYPAEEEIARCVWLYTGYYFDLWGLFNWMESRGITYLHDALSLFVPIHIDTTSKETMLDGLAEAVFDYPMTRTMGAGSMSLSWIEDMVHFIRDLDANCAVFSGHHACKQTWSVFSRVRDEITRQTGVPVLCLQGDSWSRRITTAADLRGQLDAFVGSVVARKRRRAARRRRRQNMFKTDS